MKKFMPITESEGLNTMKWRKELWPIVYGTIMCMQGNNIIYRGGIYEDDVIHMVDVVDHIYDVLNDGRYSFNGGEVHKEALVAAVDEVLGYMALMGLVEYDNDPEDAHVELKCLPKGKGFSTDMESYA